LDYAKKSRPLARQSKTRDDYFLPDAVFLFFRQACCMELVGKLPCRERIRVSACRSLTQRRTFLEEVTSMMRCVVPSLALLAMSVGTMVAGAELKSGLEVGQKAGAFQVKDCTGPSKGKSLCYR